MAVKFQTEEEIRDIEARFKDLLDHCSHITDQKDRKLIKKAFQFANEAHRDMRRKSGEPYIIHPISVSKIVAYEIGLGASSVISALLHDVVEDTEYTLDDISLNFGNKIAVIIDGLTKIAGVFDKKSTIQLENFRKLLLTLSDDVRVILIKLADRLDNMRTLDSLSRNKQLKVAGETNFLFAPLAHRLGLYTIKTELEDLALKYQNPAIYNEISQKIKDSEKKRLLFINKFSLPIIEKLNEHNIEYDISGRPKSINSIFSKMEAKKVKFEEIFDLFAIRVVFEPNPSIPEKVQCWNIYSLITDIYMPKPERIRDWVSTPKANGYEALHGTVMGPNGKWVEVQIRTTRMNDIAERGFAAHWKYKNNGQGESELDKWIKRIRELLDNPDTDALEFMDEFKLNLYSSEILVFTPKGKIITLPKNASVIDFAYEIHTEVGNRAIGAKVNQKLVPLSHTLSSGDQVEVLTSDIQRTQREWLDYAITARAKSNIKSALRAENKIHIETGKKILEEKLRDISLHPNSRIIKKLITGYEVSGKDDLYLKIGSGIITLDNLKKVLKKNTRSKWIKYWELTYSKNLQKGRKVAESDQKTPAIDLGKPLIIREGVDEPGKNYRIAKCCSPIPGDEIVGYKSPNETIIIHSAKCPTATKLMSSHGNLIVSARWTSHKILSFLAGIKIQGIDKIGIVNSITNVISHDLNANIRKINVETHDGIFEGSIELYVHDTKHLNNLIMNLFKINGVISVNRIDAGRE
ncbi:MAG: bifunctional (p)ppGpp synthetase/guanosine-3',5'-bis(diphosphate) 3'-pyrophosphohydrolase [Marinilabiliales bacterium]|nr:MAG: bifunctional (p)ppGpp synthetase/guanosine-3',5'-bis(diphosphate) 3'-pyrophosphohydrolase [Marinilabiliales bacterium]